MRRSTLIALATGALPALGACHAAPPRLPPEGAPVCPAPHALEPGETEWQDDGGTTDAPAADSVALRLAGAYRVLEFTTEGASGAPPVRWTMRLVTTDDSVRRPGGAVMAGTARGGQMLLAGARLRPGVPFDSARAAAGRLFGVDAIAVRYARDARGASALWFQTDPGVLDGLGSLYWVSSVSDSLLVGRWQYGGIAASWVRRGGEWTFESARGFFCATRVPEAASRAAEQPG